MGGNQSSEPLPPELNLAIFDFLNLKEALSMCQTNSAYKKYCNNARFWMEFAQKRPLLYREIKKLVFKKDTNGRTVVRFPELQEKWWDNTDYWEGLAEKYHLKRWTSQMHPRCAFKFYSMLAQAKKENQQVESRVDLQLKKARGFNQTLQQMADDLAFFSKDVYFANQELERQKQKRKQNPTHELHKCPPY